MTQALLYLPARFFETIRDFIYHWYVGSFRNVSHFMLNRYESLDKTFALRINLHNLFRPMYQDRSVIGYVIGFLFRSFKIIIASIIYLSLFFISVFIYLLWVLAPVVIIYKAIKSL